MRDHRAKFTLFLLLACGAAFLTLQGIDSESERRVEPLSNISPESIRHILIERNGKENLVLERRGKQWWFTFPVERLARLKRILPILRLPQTPSHTRINLQKVDLADFSLVKPKVRLFLDQAEFMFGITESLSARRYVLHEGNIHLIEDYLYPQLMLPIGFFLPTEEQ